MHLVGRIDAEICWHGKLAGAYVYEAGIIGAVAGACCYLGLESSLAV